MKEKRQQARVHAGSKLEVEINEYSESNFYIGLFDDAMVVNLSTGGLFVATYTPLKINETFRLSFALPPDDVPVEAQARVIWSREFNAAYPATHPGMGVKFTMLSAEAEKLIARYIASVREPYFYPDEELDNTPSI